MKQSLPWESVPPPIYPAQSSLKPRKKWVQTGGWILVVVLLLFGISTRSRNPLLAFVSLAFSVLYLLTLMTKKDAALTSRGLEIFYDMQFTTNYEFFPWEDINAIVCEDRGHADMVRLHIGHGNTEKALFFPREDLDVGERLHAVDLAAGGEILQRGEHDAHGLLLARLFLRRLMHTQSEQHQRRCGCQHDGADSDGHQQLDHGKAAVVSFHPLASPSAVKWVMV